METNNPQNDHTKDRILDEAERLFAKFGYQGVSVREITQAAGVNSAAVNYHFGSKKNLYMEVFRSRWIPRGKRVAAMSRETISRGPSSPEHVLQSVVRAFLQTFESDDECWRHFQLMARELSQPSEALTMVMSEVMRPNLQLFLRALSPHMPADLPPESGLLYAFSVVGVLMHFIVGRELIAKLAGLENDLHFRKLIEDHITNFCLYGILGAHRKEAL